MSIIQVQHYLFLDISFFEKNKTKRRIAYSLQAATPSNQDNRLLFESQIIHSS